MKTLLLVEDSDVEIRAMQMAFELTDCTCRLKAIRSGEEAIDYLAGQGAYAGSNAPACPDAILLDLNLPGRSGHEVLQWIRAQPGLKDLPVIVLTGSLQTADCQKALSLGATSYHLKPDSIAGRKAFLKSIEGKWLS